MPLGHEKITFNTRKNSYWIVVTRQRRLTDFFPYAAVISQIS